MSHGARTIDPVAPRSKFYQGPFGRLFQDLPPWAHGLSDQDLDGFLSQVSNVLMVEAPGELPADIAADPDKIEELEQKFSSKIPAGYTYFGQFIDHDITFDPASSLMRTNDPNALLNFRTPRLDLDNLYGAGRAAQPYLYEQNNSVDDHKAKFAIGLIQGRPDLPDLPRFGNRALIGDMRNDENAVVSQLQLAFLLAHNNLIDRARVELGENADTDAVFERARKTLRWLYQHIVWNDFIPRIVIDEIHKCALSLEDTCGMRKVWQTGFNDIYNWRNQPFMPVEFSVAAYRFGHSMVRNSYQTNNPIRGFGEFVPIFDNSDPANPNPEDLRGFRPMTPDNSIQWDWFLPMTTSSGPFPQLARKIDTKLANALSFLFEEPTGSPLNVLAFRNLKRGVAFDLPSGSAVASRLCQTPLKLKSGEPDALWYYVLREAQGNGGNTLGRVGSIIVCAVFAGLLRGDPNSWFSMEPCWTPAQDSLLKDGVDNIDDKSWTLASIIRLAGLKPDGIGFA